MKLFSMVMMMVVVSIGLGRWVSGLVSSNMVRVMKMVMKIRF